ncbi:hypothetical protein H6758_01970 [Candidatus Nomurabacteria bacterium]|nr:hypothetical protein [Candidatus Nomurabacteria bacterium]
MGDYFAEGRNFARKSIELLGKVHRVPGSWSPDNEYLGFHADVLFRAFIYAALKAMDANPAVWTEQTVFAQGVDLSVSPIQVQCGVDRDFARPWWIIGMMHDAYWLLSGVVVHPNENMALEDDPEYGTSFATDEFGIWLRHWKACGAVLLEAWTAQKSKRRPLSAD